MVNKSLIEKKKNNIAFIVKCKHNLCDNLTTKHSYILLTTYGRIKSRFMRHPKMGRNGKDKYTLKSRTAFSAHNLRIQV